MATTITKILVRQGTDIQRRTANINGIVFSSGEPAYCIDTKRLYIGDGVSSGGQHIGIQNLGTVNNLFGNYQYGLSYEMFSRFLDRGAAVGDIVYDKDTRGLYALTGLSTDPVTGLSYFPPLSSDFTKFDFVTLINDSQFEYNQAQQLQIKDQGITSRQLSFGIVDNYTIGKPAIDAPFAVLEDSIENKYLQEVAANTLKCRYSNTTGNPQDLAVLPKTVVGRTETSSLTCFTFDVILKNATFGYANGVVVDQTVTPPVWKLDTNKFTVGTNIILKAATTVQGAITVNGDATITGTTRCSQDVIAYFSSDINLKENIKPIDSPLKAILKLAGYSFDWKKEASEDPNYAHLQGNDYGLIAQEVEKVIPEAVQTREDGIKAVNYNKVIPFLIEGIKQLKQEVDELKNKSCCKSCHSK